MSLVYFGDFSSSLFPFRFVFLDMGALGALAIHFILYIFVLFPFGIIIGFSRFFLCLC